LGLAQVDLADGGLAGDDVPILDNNRVVFVERAFVLGPTPEEMAAMMVSGDESLANLSSGVDAIPPASSMALSVPEPPALMLAAVALIAICVMKPNKIR